MRTRRFPYKGLIVSLVLFALVALCVSALLTRVASVSAQERADRVRRLVRQAAITCYAVEGCYPNSLVYLQDNYGVTYDEEAYIVRYDAFASNIMPDIAVLVRGQAAS